MRIMMVGLIWFPLALQGILLGPVSPVWGADACQDLIVNGQFEVTGFDTPNVGWTPVTVNAAPQFAQQPVYSGTRSMRLGLVDEVNTPSLTGIQQIRAIPSGATSLVLNFQYYSIQEPSPGNDLRYVEIYDGATNQIINRVWSNQSDDRVWRFEQIDLTGVDAASIRLLFAVSNEGAGGRSALYLDNVTLIACGGAATTATPTTTALTPTATTPNPGTATVTPTLIATQTSAPPPTPATGCREIIVNGDFESTTGWVAGKDPWPPLYQTDIRHGGAQSILLGRKAGQEDGNQNSYSSIRQLITIPSNVVSATLRWAWQLNTEQAPDDNPKPPSDRQELLLLDASQNTVLQKVQRELKNDTQWKVIENVGLMAFRGHSFYLYFNAYNDSNSLRTWAYVDDVSLIVCYPDATPIPTATATLAATTTPFPTASPTTSLSPSLTPTPSATPMSELSLAQPEPSVTLTPEVGAASRSASADSAIGDPDTEQRTVGGEDDPVSIMQPSESIEPPAATPAAESESFWRRLPSSLRFDTSRLGPAALLIVVLGLVGLIIVGMYNAIRQNRSP